MPSTSHPDVDIDWIKRDRKVIRGLDHLGVELVSVALYQNLLPGLTNVTQRARYYSFYPWVIDRYVRSAASVGDRVAWRTRIRRLDFAYATACMAFEASVGESRDASIVGGDKAREVLAGQAETDLVDLKAASDVDASGRVIDGGYFKSPQGGFGQYYQVPLQELGVLQPHEEPVWPSVKLTTFAGEPLCRAVDETQDFERLEEAALSGAASVLELAGLGRGIHPDAMDPNGREAEILTSLLFMTDEDICRGQDVARHRSRRDSLRLMLDFAARGQNARRPDNGFRWSCMVGVLPDGGAWQYPEGLAQTHLAWSVYQRNEVLNYSLESLFRVALAVLDDGEQTPTTLARAMVDLAVEAAGLNGAVASWVESSRRPNQEAASEPWGETSTWQWQRNLREAIDQEDWPAACGWAIRVLGRLATDRGHASTRPFDCFPKAGNLDVAYEIHLGRWWGRADGRSGQRATEFLEELILEWVLFRHLRVATRKLANQRVSTFKYRPEGGKLVRTADAPGPTYTSPRVRQAFRIMSDLGLVARNGGVMTLTKQGLTMQERLRD